MQGNFVLFDAANIKTLGGGGPISFTGDTFKAVLCNSSQALTAAFAGGSGDCRYADLTGELATANGYTHGGLTLTSVSLTAAGGVVTFDSADALWTLTGGITFKYLVIYDFTTTNKDLVYFCDMDTGGGSVSPVAGSLLVAIAGIETITD